MKNIKVGDNVWCWDPACSPKNGVVTHVNPYNIDGTFFVKLENNAFENVIWSDFRVYKNPEEKHMLQTEMVEHANFLIELAGKL